MNPTYTHPDNRTTNMSRMSRTSICEVNNFLSEFDPSAPGTLKDIREQLRIHHHRQRKDKTPPYRSAARLARRPWLKEFLRNNTGTKDSQAFPKSTALFFSDMGTWKTVLEGLDQTRQGIWYEHAGTKIRQMFPVRGIPYTKLLSSYALYRKRYATPSLSSDDDFSPR